MTISAKVIADSISNGTRITTFELEYPRFIHSEFMTHRLFSRNAASSRAIPVSTILGLIKSNMAMPSHWGKNQSGMQAKVENDELVTLPRRKKALTAIEAWEAAGNIMIKIAKSFETAKYHKQIVNRLVEPFTHIKVVVTATEYDNFFWLRDHLDAQPEIRILAEAMRIAQNESMPIQLVCGMWHVPYYKDGYWIAQSDCRYDEQTVDVHGNTLAAALAVSSSCSAQVSYRLLNDSIEKAEDIYGKLIKSFPPHFSPFEHQATPMDSSDNGFHNSGVTHEDKHGNYWSGNFCNWVQHRQLLMETMKLDPMTSKYKGENNE